MDDLMSLLESKDKNVDLLDKLTNLLDRQTDHKMSPNILLGFVGLFNLLSILNLVHGTQGTEIKNVSSSSEGENPTTNAQSMVDTISGMMKGENAGQPDLMGLLGSLASKKKINPNLLLSLFSMLNNMSGPSPSTSCVEESGTSLPKSAPLDEKQEKKTVDDGASVKDKPGTELKYNSKKA